MAIASRGSGPLLDYLEFTDRMMSYNPEKAVHLELGSLSLRVSRLPGFSNIRLSGKGSAARAALQLRFCKAGGLVM